MLVESSLLGAALEAQDDRDRKSIALFGMKPSTGTVEGGGGKSPGKLVLPELDSGRHTARGSIAKFQETPRRRPSASPRDASSSHHSYSPGDGSGESWHQPEAGPVVTLDKRCLACSGSQATVLAGFKLACLQYSPSSVEYQKVMYSRSELIRLRIDLLNQVKDQLRTVE